MESLPDKWSAFTWPDWVPETVRSQIESFWAESQRRSPKEWEECRQQNDAPTLGRRVRCYNLQNGWVEGRYVPAWNNMGRVIQDDGTVVVVSCGQWQALDDAAERIATLRAKLEAEGKTVYAEAEWLAEGARRFGPERNNWAFKCVSCGNIQSANSVLRHGLEEEPETIRRWVTNNCEGRYLKGYGCDWSLGGMFQIHRVVLISDQGAAYPMFEFADQSTETIRCQEPQHHSIP